jgi:superfamily II DNA or RNA helicase
MTVEEGVEKGWLAKPAFRVLQVISNSNYDSDDANKLTREHLFYNPVVNQKAAQIANAAVANGEGPVLILVDEIEQFSHIEPLLRFKCAFAYGTLTPVNQRYVQEKYRQNDNVAIVKDFNDGKIPILIGTSAISIGTDIRAVKTGIYLRGGKSPIDVPQSVGRCTRLFPGKDSFTWIDFDVTNIDTLHRHTEARIDLYNSIYPDVEVY